ncbi:flagellar filament capping protein FliD [Sphingomonas sp. SUN019]|uniref:flagellar filament capping protein FliD n=1 Tax=Sphingomonas sp. SUN019 TaxID=2937788 RepID=UPI002164A896|nr:flagellar filament capping protein FliD [Sphingomonas sp. SUN019]UVO51209.1 flagellar filament capping protein FliD [Sphingomonas sp. SUN019]
MVTTTGTTSTTSTANVTSAAAQSLLTSLDAGSGVDTDSLVKGLVEAQFAAKNAALTARSEKLTSQISGVSTLKNTITDFAAALENLAKGGTLASQPVSSAPGVLSVSALGGAKLSGFTASVRVDRLATAQTAVSRTPVASKDAAIGTGTFTLQLGTATYNPDGSMASLAAGSSAAMTIDITSANNSLTGMAAAINARKAGVTASVVTDANGDAYLSLKGATGTAQAFTLQATSDPGGTLSAFNVGPGGGLAITSQSGNAQLVVDGVAVERASNSISDLVDGVKLELSGVSTTPVSLSSTTPTAALSSAVNDFVATYNEVMAIIQEQTDPITGVLRGDSGAQNFLRQMKALTLKPLLTGAADGTPKTLADLGVGTTRTGTLSVNADTLVAAIKNNPASIEAMFAITSDGNGLIGALNSVKLNATSTLYGLGASSVRFTAAQSELAEQKDKIADQSTNMSDRLTQQFASMNAKVAAYKSTQTFLENQIKAWNNSDN